VTVVAVQHVAHQAELVVPVPTSRAGGHGGEAGTGSWERAGRSLLPWAAETPHKVVNTIKRGCLGWAALFFYRARRTWPYLPLHASPVAKLAESRALFWRPLNDATH
jgi:hypothetical protein